jgi:hypothetical protein
MLIQHTLSPEEQRVLRTLGSLPTAKKCGASECRLAKWTASGPGPVALTGGQWINGVALCPRFHVPFSSRVASLTWDWKTDKLGEWQDRAQLRLMLLDVEAKACWTVDVTSLPASTVIVSEDLVLSANCAVALQLKAGDRIGKLYSPPFVRSVEISVRYRF